MALSAAVGDDSGYDSRWARPLRTAPRPRPCALDRRLPRGAALYRVEWDQKARASHGADAWHYLSLSWRAPMRDPEKEKVPIGISMSDLTMDQFMDIEDEPDRFNVWWPCRRRWCK
jgi:hypothetical protein